MAQQTLKELLQRERERLEARQSRLIGLLSEINREQQRLDQESQELATAERVFSRLEFEGDTKVLPYTPPSARQQQEPAPEPEVLDMAFIISEAARPRSERERERERAEDRPRSQRSL